MSTKMKSKNVFFYIFKINEHILSTCLVILTANLLIYITPITVEYKY